MEKKSLRAFFDSRRLTAGEGCADELQVLKNALT